MKKQLKSPKNRLNNQYTKRPFVNHILVKVDKQVKKVYPNRALCLFLSRGPLDSPLRTEMNNKKGYPHLWISQRQFKYRIAYNVKRIILAPSQLD